MMEDKGEIKCEAQFAKVESVTTWKKVVVGVILVVLAGCSFTCSNVIQKIICPTLSFWTLMLVRSLMQTTVMAIHVMVTKSSILSQSELQTKVLLQGFLGGIQILAIYVAVKNIPLGNASAIFFCTPVATFALAIFMLKERFGMYRGLISVLMISGVILITRPTFIFGSDFASVSNDSENNSTAPTSIGEFSLESSNGIGYSAAFAVPLLQAINSILSRQCKAIKPSVLMFWFGVGIFISGIGGIGTAFLVSAAGGLSMNYESILFLADVEIIFAVVISIVGTMGNLFLILAVRYISPSKANVFRSFEVLLNYLLQLFVENLPFHPPDIAGIIFLIGAVFATGFE